MNESTTRFSAVSRRAFLSGLSIAAIAATGACGASSSAGTAAPSTAPSTGTAPSAAASTPSASASSSASTSTGKQIASGAKATVSWTYSSSGGGMARNPYMAVWIEDAQGAYVKTLALYHRQSGDNWLRELSGWYTSSGGTDTTTSGTVPAGSYTASWDGSAAAGGQVEQGTYYVCVESAVEHGSDSLVRQEVKFAGSAVTTTLTPSGSISAASVDYTV